MEITRYIQVQTLEKKRNHGIIIKSEGKKQYFLMTKKFIIKIPKKKGTKNLNVHTNKENQIKKQRVNWLKYLHCTVTKGNKETTKYI